MAAQAARLNQQIMDADRKQAEYTRNAQTCAVAFQQEGVSSLIGRRFKPKVPFSSASNSNDADDGRAGLQEDRHCKHRQHQTGTARAECASAASVCVRCGGCACRANRRRHAVRGKWASPWSVFYFP
eukprot:1158256-Pelagomonas_calceolata.AAC.14